MLSVNQPWDKLKVCAVGRSYPPELYDFIENPKVRNMMERIAIETEEDYQKLIAKLEEFNVKVIRTNLNLTEEGKIRSNDEGVHEKPPMCPRDDTIMVGNRFYSPAKIHWRELIKMNSSLTDDEIPQKWSDVKKLSPELKKYIIQLYKSFAGDPQTLFEDYTRPNHEERYKIYEDIQNYVSSQGNTMIHGFACSYGATIIRAGKDLYTSLPLEFEYGNKRIIKRLREEFSDYRVHILREMYGHGDAHLCPVKPGLLMCTEAYENSDPYNITFPGWAVVRLEKQSWFDSNIQKQLEWKRSTGGRWWVDGQSYDQDTVDYIDTWLSHWVNYVEETVFDVNMLVIDKHNIICNNYNKKAFQAFEVAGITPHIINFRHRYFWDGGIHCITSDLDRDGERQDYFPERGDNVIG